MNWEIAIHLDNGNYLRMDSKEFRFLLEVRYGAEMTSYRYEGSDESTRKTVCDSRMSRRGEEVLGRFKIKYLLRASREPLITVRVTIFLLNHAGFPNDFLPLFRVRMERSDLARKRDRLNRLRGWGKKERKNQNEDEWGAPINSGLHARGPKKSNTQTR